MNEQLAFLVFLFVFIKDITVQVHTVVTGNSRWKSLKYSFREQGMIIIEQSFF